MSHPGEKKKYREIDYLNDIIDDFDVSIRLQLEEIARLQKKDMLTIDEHRAYNNAIKIIKSDLTSIRVGIGSIPESWREQNPDIDWLGFIESRNKMIHEYPSVEYEVIVNHATHDVPVIVMGVRRRMEELKSMGLDKGHNSSRETQNQTKHSAPRKERERSLGRSMSPGSEDDVD